VYHKAIKNIHDIPNGSYFAWGLEAAKGVSETYNSSVYQKVNDTLVIDLSEEKFINVSFFDIPMNILIIQELEPYEIPENLTIFYRYITVIPGMSVISVPLLGLLLKCPMIT
jgi:hypothetical protein